jgi:hypothetical protein
MVIFNNYRIKPDPEMSHGSTKREWVRKKQRFFFFRETSKSRLETLD